MRPLCYYGAPVLRKKCKQVTEITPFIEGVIKEMKQAVKEHNGAGLAAPQIGYDLRIFVNVFSKETDEDGNPLSLQDPEVYINPSIVNFSKKNFSAPEGCLSIPGISCEIERPDRIDIEYTSIDGKKKISKNEKGWRSKCFQHEIDHLDGILFIDRLPEKELKKIEPLLVSIKKKTLDQTNII